MLGKENILSKVMMVLKILFAFSLRHEVSNFMNLYFTKMSMPIVISFHIRTYTYKTLINKKHTYSIQNSHFNRAHIHTINLIFYTNTFSSTGLKYVQFIHYGIVTLIWSSLGKLYGQFSFACDWRKLLVTRKCVRRNSIWVEFLCQNIEKHFNTQLKMDTEIHKQLENFTLQQ